MADNGDPNQKQPGEKGPGTLHYNPGNMSGKTTDESEQQANADRIQSRHQAKSFASELEGMGRRNPLGAMAAALLVGVMIGVISRGRSS
jgi:hypothetical protein